jgi:hypothetical protein
MVIIGPASRRPKARSSPPPSVPFSEGILLLSPSATVGFVRARFCLDVQPQGAGMWPDAWSLKESSGFHVALAANGSANTCGNTGRHSMVLDGIASVEIPYGNALGDTRNTRCHGLRATHNPKVAGSNPAPATKDQGPGIAPGPCHLWGGFAGRLWRRSSTFRVLRLSESPTVTVAGDSRPSRSGITSSRVPSLRLGAA